MSWGRSSDKVPKEFREVVGLILRSSSTVPGGEGALTESWRYLWGCEEWGH